MTLRASGEGSWRVTLRALGRGRVTLRASKGRKAGTEDDGRATHVGVGKGEHRVCRGGSLLGAATLLCSDSSDIGLNHAIPWVWRRSVLSRE